jgi:small conductance mechanosensitive channel
MVIPGLTAASLFAGLGVGAVAIGFAFQDIFQNFLAGVLIMIRERMGIGDTIKCQSITGKVERITLRETHIRQLTGELTIVPNSLLFKEPVQVLTDQDLRRDELTIEIGYGPAETIQHTIDTMRNAIEKTQYVSDQKPVIVVLREFAGNIKVLVQWWTPSAQRSMVLTRNDVMFSIRRAFDAEKIAVPPGGPAHMIVDSLPPLVLEGAAAEALAGKPEERPGE